MQGLLVWLNEKTKLNLISKAIPLLVSTNFTIGTRAFAITCDIRKALAYQQNKQLSIQLVDKSGNTEKNGDSFQKNEFCSYQIKRLIILGAHFNG
jgi:hypothetical protein